MDNREIQAGTRGSIRSVQRALEMGIPIAMGTDAATPYNFHGDNAMELQWMSQAGLSPMQAIVAATSNAARALGWNSWLGTLIVGRLAEPTTLPDAFEAKGRNGGPDDREQRH